MFQNKTYAAIAMNVRRKHPNYSEAKVNDTVTWIIQHPNYNGYYKMPQLAKEKEIQEESEVKQISFESLMKGDTTAWNASKQQ